MLKFTAYKYTYEDFVNAELEILEALDYDVDVTF